MSFDGLEEAHAPVTDIASGNDFSRVGLSGVLKLALSGSIDWIYVSELDRLGRDLIETPRLLHCLKDSGVIVRTASGLSTDGISNHLPLFRSTRKIARRR
jgi:DNA invertase Pin-like site-specific DNA recombinase